MSDLIEALPLPLIYYHSRETTYWRRDESNRWIKVNDTSARSFIAEHSYSKCPAEPGTNSEVDRCLMSVQARQNVAYVGSLAGYAAGIYRMSNNQILVTDSPAFIPPKAGEWRTLDAVFQGLFRRW